MKKTNKYIVISIALAVVIVVFSVLLILYDKHVFDISFIKRPDETAAVETTAAVQTEPGETETEPPETGGDTAPEESTGAETEVPKSVFDELHEKYPAVKGEELSPTEKTYGDGIALFRLDGFEAPEKEYLGDTFIKTEYRVSRTGEVQGLRVIKPVDTLAYRRSVDVYMGMIVVSDGKALSFYNGRGELLYKYEGEEQLTFAYERDSADRPLFRTGGAYYYIDEELHELVPSDFDERDSRGLHYNYPTDFGRSEGEYTVFRNGDSYGIQNAEGVRKRNAIYEKGYNFSEGLGLVVYRGDAYYFNEDMDIVIDGERRGIQMVDFKDENGVGSIYYDGGYVLARIIKYHPLYEVNPERYNIVEEDAEVVIDKKGRVYELPEGCSAKAYSDQRILVENNGKYGFYAVKGAWIADTEYTYATPYHEGLAVVGKNNVKGVIDLDGNFVIPLSYGSISVCTGGVIVCYSKTTGYDIYIKTDL